MSKKSKPPKHDWTVESEVDFLGLPPEEETKIKRRARELRNETVEPVSSDKV